MQLIDWERSARLRIWRISDALDRAAVVDNRQPVNRAVVTANRNEPAAVAVPRVWRDAPLVVLRSRQLEQCGASSVRN